MHTLLSREQFREQCLLRDSKTCMVCHNTQRDLSVHHILNRNLFEDGGYYLENGITLCDLPGSGHNSDGYSCHMQAESTVLSPLYLWSLLQIEQPVLPAYLQGKHFKDLDCWGNWQDQEGQWQAGPLFQEPVVQNFLRRNQKIQWFYG